MLRKCFTIFLLFSFLLIMLLFCDIRAYAQGLDQLPAKSKQKVIWALIDTGIDPELYRRFPEFFLKNEDEIPDNGIDDDHDGAIDNVFGRNVLTNRGDAVDDDKEDYHGTRMFSIFWSQRFAAKAIYGLDVDIKVLPVKCLDKDGEGGPLYTELAIEYARRRIVEEHALGVLNISLTQPSTTDDLISYIGRAQKDGILLVTAAGNNGVDLNRSGFYPGSHTVQFDNMINVGASDLNDIWYRSNYSINHVDIAAVGADMLTVGPAGMPAYYAGTSISAVLVSSVVVILLRNSDWDYWHIKKVIFQTTDHLPQLEHFVREGRRLNIAKAFATVVANKRTRGTP